MCAHCQLDSADRPGPLSAVCVRFCLPHCHKLFRRSSLPSASPCEGSIYLFNDFSAHTDTRKTISMSNVSLDGRWCCKLFFDFSQATFPSILLSSASFPNYAFGDSLNYTDALNKNGTHWADFVRVALLC